MPTRTSGVFLTSNSSAKPSNQVLVAGTFNPLGTKVAGMGRAPLGARLIYIAEEFYDLPEGVLKDKTRRNGNVSKARWAVAHVLIEVAGWSLPKIGRLLQKDHTSIHHGYGKSKQLIRIDPLFFEAVRVLTEEVTPDESHRP